MKVKECIEFLNKCDPDAEIEVDMMIGDETWYRKIENIEDCDDGVLILV